MVFADVQIGQPAQTLQEIAAQLRQSAHERRPPILVMMCGLPGTGKSYVGRLLSVHLCAALVASDHVRKAFFPRPSYSPDEHGAVHQLCCTLVEVLLLDGVPVVLDATHAAKWQRARVYDIAERLMAHLAIVHTTASELVVRQRLERRGSQWRDPFDLSDAVSAADYSRVQQRFEPLDRPHVVIDSAEDVDSAVLRIVRQLEDLEQ